ncbi:light-harvesting protein [Lamprobacter modestohalophilus]|uniref:Light-harvesting protein n=1 Tax=Lamprobacter modestohalophilus TaxID=1064514 RepID=A0A9X1B4X3_9GAMM|nr:light-harvesting antenna LH1, alpha subunit [Lamprobacter modestohalophilus]MBK1619201.1 light-harvesting protein [Lamprobacter modestohalophilus]
MQVPYLMADPTIAKPDHPEEDWKIWTVINPATWMVPFFFILFIQMWLIHTYALSLPGYGFKDSVQVAAPVAVVQPAPAAE